MPRYYFALDNAEYERDEDGSEFVDAHAARIAAVTFVGEYLRDHPELVWNDDKLSVHVEDDQRERLLTVTVSSSGKIAAC